MNLSILNFDIGLVLFYLVLTLGVGIYKGRNVRTLRGFAVGDSRFSNTALTATITASWLGAGSIIGIIEEVYSAGIVWFFIFLGEVIEMYVFQLFASRIVQFKGCLSVAEILGIWYGKPAEIIGGICTVLLSAGFVGAQVAAIGYVFYEFFGISSGVGILIAAGVVVLYSTFGGIKSVTVTDIIQLAFFMAAMPIIAGIIIDPAGGYKGITEALPHDHLHITNGYGSLKEYFWLFVFFSLPFFDPCLIQRTLMAEDKDQIKDCFKAAAFTMIVFYSSCTIIALSMRVIDESLVPTKVLYYTINNFIPVGAKGLGVAGLLAVIMSSADSYLNVSGVAMINDVINPMRKRSLSDRQQLFIARLTTFVIGVVAIIIAVHFESILQIMMKSWIIWSPIIVGPLYATFLGIRANLNTFLISMAAGVATVVLWLLLEIESKTGVDTMVPSLIANLTAFSLAALYYHKFAPEKLHTPELPNSLSLVKHGRKMHIKRKKVKSFFLNALRTIRAPYELVMQLFVLINVVEFSRRRVLYFGAQYKMFANFGLVGLMIIHFLWPGSGNIVIYDYQVSLVLRTVAATLLFLLLTHDAWPQKCQRYLPVYWHFTLMYSLVTLATFLYLYHKGSTPWLINVALSLFVLATLVDWLSFTVLTVLGIALGCRLYDYLAGSLSRSGILEDPEKTIIFLYVAVFSSIIGVLFSRNRELSQVVETNKKLKEALAVKTEILDNISHETRTPIQGVLGMSSALVGSWQHMNEERRYSAISAIYDSSKRLMSFVDNLVDLSKYKQGKAKFEFKQVHFRSILEEVLKEVELFYMPNRNIDLKVDIAAGVKDDVFGDEYKLTQLLRNIIGNAFKYMDEGELSISLSNQDDQLLLCVDDEGVGIPEAELEEIFEPFIQSSRTKTGAGGTGVGLTVARDIVIGHKGRIWAENRSPKGTRFCIMLPLLSNGNKV